MAIREVLAQHWQGTPWELELSGQTSSKTTETYAIIIKLARKKLKNR